MTRHPGRTYPLVAIARAIGCQAVSVAATVLLSATAASAGSLFVNFCPGERRCPNGIADASILFMDVLTTDYPNDFKVSMRIEGAADGPRYLNELSFKVPGHPWTDSDVANRNSNELGSQWSTVLPGRPQEWNFYVNFADGHVLAPLDVVKLRARFVSADGRPVGKLSLKGTALAAEPAVRVPEPGTMLLLGIACLGLATVSRRAI